jgi:hypothetical protein
MVKMKLNEKDAALIESLKHAVKTNKLQWAEWSDVLSIILRYQRALDLAVESLKTTTGLGMPLWTCEQERIGNAAVVALALKEIEAVLNETL